NEATEIYLKTGEQYSEQGFFQKAVAVYKNVLKLSPGLVQGHARLADAYKRLGLVSDAVAQLDLAAVGYQKAGKPAEALAALRQIVEINPDNVVARIKLAEAASQSGAVDEAARELGKAAEKLKAQGRIDEYIRVAERLLFFQPENWDVARALAEAYIGKQGARQALARLQGALKANGRDPRNVALMARAFEQLDAPKAASVWRELAQIHDEVGRAAERDDALRKALALAPGNTEGQELARRWGTRSGLVPGAGLAPLRPLGSGLSDAQGAGGGGGGGGAPTGARHGLPAPLGLAGQPRFKMDIGAPGAAPSASPPANPDVSRIMAETEVFVKYGLLDRAVDHLRRVFEMQPHDLPAREKLSAVLAQLGRKTEAAAELLHMANQLAPSDRAAAAKLAARALELDPTSDRARALASDAAPVERAVVAAAAPSLGSSPSLLSSSSSSPGGELITEEVALIASDDDILDEDAEGGGIEIEVDPDSSGGPEVLAFEDDPLSSVNRPRDGREAELLAEMEQVDFFIEQAMPDEAAALLGDLQARFGHHQAIERKQNQVRLMAYSPLGAIPGGVPSTVIDARSGGLGGGSGPSPVARMAEGEKADASTHGDLGIAYKEMGLLDAAIFEFTELARDPRRRVFALTMIGECLEAKGSHTDAVVRYKEALNVPQATPTESTLLYYLLGAAFEQLGDRQEALYFYEKVARRDSKFRDVESKLAALRPRSARQA
ncbi:MAG TPA: tetratricopeptide repeat protein, partial [Polyangia bacterium]|nr:tetratricopeptide repeat protein [Polyangia bacterium]